mgnify:CR=1 FL=1
MKKLQKKVLYILIQKRLKANMRSKLLVKLNADGTLCNADICLTKKFEEYVSRTFQNHQS